MGNAIPLTEAPGTTPDDVVVAMNTVSRFLACEQIRNSDDLIDLVRPPSNADATPQTDVIVLCACSVLYGAEVTFSTVKQIIGLKGTSLCNT